jgi:hypothetical protein
MTIDSRRNPLDGMETFEFKDMASPFVAGPRTGGSQAKAQTLPLRKAITFLLRSSAK